ncbi:glycosyltransferase family 4 protein [Tamlana sp. I1]|uniref:glycosyltransferase family 4 protein n=1 Tax=Tamlana sp. I1 TaxID=2762061 RepID=UPI00188E69EE|nr:glycosyltransferase family 4 protein [Tamlana sp. I1]
MVKKIIILTDQVSEIGGINSLIYLKSNYWVSVKSYQVDIITTEQKGKPSFYPLDKKVRLHDLSINYDRNTSYFKRKNLIRIFKNLVLLQKKISNIKPDFIIIANHIPVTFFFPLLITKAKFIKEFHFSKFHISKQKQSVFKKFEEKIQSKLDTLIVLSPEERTFYKNDNIAVIPNPIDIDIKDDLKFQGRKHIAMSAGRIAQVKRFDTLIDIWSLFVKNNTDWKLEIYGDGEEKYVKALNEKIKKLELSNFVEIKPSTNSLKTKMYENGLYLMTSEAECFPMVLLEAKSCGLPIISFNCPTGPRNILKNNFDGILVEDKNNKEFVDKLIELTTNESLRIKLATNAYNTINDYSLNKIMTLWDNQILNKKL